MWQGVQCPAIGMKVYSVFPTKCDLSTTKGTFYLLLKKIEINTEDLTSFPMIPNDTKFVKN